MGVSRAVARRRIATGAIAVIAAAALAGCGLAGGSSGSGSATSGSKNLTVWFPGNDPNESKLVEQTLVPQFEKQTGAHVDVTYVDYTNLSPKLSAAFAAGTAPDVFGNGPAAVADLVTNDRIEDLDPYVAKLSQADRDDLAAALPGGQVGGKQYLIPLQMQGQLLAYNKADFKAAGLDPDNPPTTWEGIRDAAAKLTKRDASGKITRSGLLLASDPIGRQQSFATLIESAGGTLIGQDGNASVNTPQGTEALNFYTSLFRGWQGNKPVATGLGVTYSANPPAQQPLVQGTASITNLNVNAIVQIAHADPTLDLGVIAPPKFTDAAKGEAFGGAGPGLMINKDSKNKDLAWQFIEFMIGKDVSLQYVQSFGGLPVRASAADSPYVKNSPILQAALKAFPQFVANPNVPGWVQARDTMDTYLERALAGKASTADTLSQMSSQVDSVLKKSR
jgi:multiple sugar transport system substrate-binding protein